MENPSQEIASVVTLLTAAASPDIQKATFQRYFTFDAGFRHPLCSVSPGPGSRERVLGIYQWYRVMSPNIDIEVKSVTHDISRSILLLDIEQLFHIRLSPFKPAPSRLLVRITLREENGLYYIAFQEDFYHPDDFVSLIIPPLSPFIRILLASTGFASNVYASVAQMIGFWTVRMGEGDGTDSELKWE